MCAPPGHEDKEVARVEVEAGLLDPARETVEPAAHVDRLSDQVDALRVHTQKVFGAIPLDRANADLEWWARPQAATRRRCSATGVCLGMKMTSTHPTT
ncbi:MAG: hypothetical protein ACI9VR_001439 [Cognaticolwellia sp.]